MTGNPRLALQLCHRQRIARLSALAQAGRDGHVGARTHELRHNRLVAFNHGAVQRRPAAMLADVHIGPGFDQGVDAGEVAFDAGQVERG
ncbi:hypothetical protein AB1Y20_004105 [Prymnesium parvum]|uniref:Uncharacterized protein n=1 Tax=Prymnesium parvum TaxID=97485 RepID=A0AB34J6Y1_PRYPA